MFCTICPGLLCGEIHLCCLSHLELVDFIPDWVERVALYHFALVLGTVGGDSYQLQLHEGTRQVVVWAHILTGNQLKNAGNTSLAFIFDVRRSSAFTSLFFAFVACDVYSRRA